MTLDEYQQQALSTRRKDTQHAVLIYPTLGLVGEAGEFADMVKKSLRPGRTLDRQEAALELGDVLWYLAVVADDLNFTLDEIGQLNGAKLAERKAQDRILQHS